MRRKIIEIEDYEDKLVTFCQFNFGALSLFSLSDSWSLRVFLEHSGFGSWKEKQAKGKQGKQEPRKEE